MMPILPCPEPMSEQQICQRAHKLFWDYVREVGESYIMRVGIDFDDVYDSIIYPNYEICLDTSIDLDVDDRGDEILGQFLPEDNTVLISSRLIARNDPRRVFTTLHEVVGHGILHGNFLRKNSKNYPNLYSTEESMKLIENTFEGQANAMAVNFLSPEGFVLALYRKVFGTWRKINYIGPGRYNLYVNGVDCSVWAASPYQLAWAVAKRIKHYFWGLSTESIMYRVLKVAIERNGHNNRDFSSPNRIFSVGECLGVTMEG